MNDLRKLDALVAEHVYGLDVFEVEFALAEPPDRRDWCIEGTNGKFVEHYSTDVALAIGVLEKLKLEAYAGAKIWFIGGMDDGTYKVWAGKQHIIYACPLPEAICRHVLHVLGVDAEVGK